MKIKYWIGALLLAVCSANFISCKDDSFPPITLSYVIEGESPIANDNSLTVSPFVTEMEFRIQGGNGIYSIESNPDPSIADYRFNGKNVLTIIPKALGETSLIIADYAGNRYILRIIVAYPDRTYRIKTVMTQIEGDNLTLKERNEIDKLIKENTPVKDGGRYVFTYTNKEMTEGKVKIYPTETTQTPLEGIFNQDRATIDRNGVNLHITLTNKKSYNYVLSYPNDTRVEMSPSIIIKENVTETYKGTYPNLHEAYGIQIVPGEAI